MELVELDTMRFLVGKNKDQPSHHQVGNPVLSLGYLLLLAGASPSSSLLILCAQQPLSEEGKGLSVSLALFAPEGWMLPQLGDSRVQ